MRQDSELLKQRLRYQARQYSAGAFARGGNPEKHIMQKAVDRIEELEKALRDILNDCINFNGGVLTECFMEQASDDLNDSDWVYKAGVLYENT